MTSSAEPIEVTPKIIEDGLSVSTTIDRQLAELSRHADELAAQYRPHEIADRQDHKDSKRARGQVRKDAEAIERSGRQLTARIDAWSADVKARAKRLAQPLRDIGEEYDSHVKAYEDGLRDARRDLLRTRYEEYAPALALPAEGTGAPLVPFGILWQRHAKAEGWDRLTVGDAKAIQSLEAVVEGIAAGERRIDSLVAEPDRADVKAIYFRTLSLDTAMDRAGELVEARARLQAMEAERAAWAAQSETAPEAGPDPAQGAVPYEPPRTLDVAPPAPSQACPQAPRPVSSGSVMSRREYEAEYEQVTGRPAPQPGPAMPEGSGASTWAFCGYCTPQQALELEAFCARVGIGRVRVFDARGRKYKLVPTKEA